MMIYLPKSTSHNYSVLTHKLQTLPEYERNATKQKTAQPYPYLLPDHTPEPTPPPNRFSPHPVQAIITLILIIIIIIIILCIGIIFILDPAMARRWKRRLTVLTHTAFSPPKCSKPSSSKCLTCNRPFSPVPNNQRTYQYTHTLSTSPFQLFIHCIKSIIKKIQ